MNIQLPLAIQLNDESTFTNFLWGKNTLLKQTLEEYLNNKKERIFYIWGHKGSGKSHLLQAACQEISVEGTAIYLPLRLLKELGPQSIENLSHQELIAIDDIDVISHEKLWEEAIFHLYNQVLDNEKTLLIISAQDPPSTLIINLADLHSRLTYGLVTQLHELDDDSKILAIQQHAFKRGLEVPRKVGHFLIQRCARNMHDLKQILERLDEASLVLKHKITIPFVKKILQL